MHGSHAHGHGHHHHPHDHAPRRSYALPIALNLAFVAVEGAAGIAIGSTALIADAGHNLSDVLGLLLAAGAAWMATREPSGRRTYGFAKAGVLAALLNALFLVFACGLIAMEAVERLLEPRPVPEPWIVIGVAAAGVVVNGVSALWLGGHGGDLNRRAALLHLIGDAAVSVGVIFAGLAMLMTGAAWIDPAVSLVVLVVILAGCWRIARDALDAALDAAPADIDVPAVRAVLESAPGVTLVHDLHIWSIGRETALTAHLVRPDGADDPLLRELAATLRARFGIAHTTIQVECEPLDDCEAMHR